MSSSYIINDPVHGVMLFDQNEEKLIKKFIDHPFFQRLRRIKQLGCGDLVFPGAVHTRFNHSIGACYLAKKLCVKLEIKTHQQNIIMIAALLHDIGHGPFSHAFEKIYINDIPEKKENFRVSHEDWTKKFIDEYARDISLAKKIGELFENKSDCNHHIISSQLDVDRMDYLLRDSHFCGVPYGLIDIKWLLSSIIKIEVGNKQSKIGIEGKGVGALEHYIEARRLMTKNIYYHGKKNAAEYLVGKFLIGIKDHLDDKMMDDCALKQFFEVYSDYVEKITTTKNTKDEEKNKFIDKSFNSYSHITDDDIWVLIRKFSLLGKGPCREIATKLLKCILPEDYELDPSRIAKAKVIVENYKEKYRKEEKWKIYVDTLDFTPYKGSKAPIYIKEKIAGSDIYHESEILHHLSDREEPTYFLYLDKDIDGKKLISDLKKNYCLKNPDEDFKRKWGRIK